MFKLQSQRLKVESAFAKALAGEPSIPNDKVYAAVIAEARAGAVVRERLGERLYGIGYAVNS